MNFENILFGVFVFSLLFLISVSDIRDQIIPDFFIILLAFGAILYDVLTGRTGIVDRLILLVSVFTVLCIIRYITHGLGFGDVKLCCILSYIGGFWVFLVSLFTATILGICTFGIIKLLKKKIEKLPFAPFITVGFLAGKAVVRFLQ